MNTNLLMAFVLLLRVLTPSLTFTLSICFSTQVCFFLERARKLFQKQTKRILKHLKDTPILNYKQKSNNFPHTMAAGQFLIIATEHSASHKGRSYCTVLNPSIIIINIIMIISIIFSEKIKGSFLKFSHQSCTDISDICRFKKRKHSLIYLFWSVKISEHPFSYLPKCSWPLLRPAIGCHDDR